MLANSKFRTEACKRYFVYIFLLILLGGCVTQQKCQKKFPPKEYSIDSVISRKIILVDSINVNFHIEYDSVYAFDTVVNTKHGCTSKIKHVETTFASAWAQVSNGVLSLSLVQKDSLIRKAINDSIEFYYKEHHVITTKIQKVVIYKTHWYDKVARVIAGIVLFFAAAKIGVKFIKP